MTALAIVCIFFCLASASHDVLWMIHSTRADVSNRPDTLEYWLMQSFRLARVLSAIAALLLCAATIAFLGRSRSIWNLLIAYLVALLGLAATGTFHHVLSMMTADRFDLMSVIRGIGAVARISLIPGLLIVVLTRSSVRNLVESAVSGLNDAQPAPRALGAVQPTGTTR